MLLAPRLLARGNERRRGGCAETRRGENIWEELGESPLAQRRGNFRFGANGTPAVPSRVLNISAIAMLII